MNYIWYNIYTKEYQNKVDIKTKIIYNVKEKNM